jgi:hypothetical protein
MRLILFLVFIVIGIGVWKTLLISTHTSNKQPSSVRKPEHWEVAIPVPTNHTTTPLKTTLALTYSSGTSFANTSKTLNLTTQTAVPNTPNHTHPTNTSNHTHSP